MDWAHFTLGGLLIGLAALTVLIRRRHRELHIRIDWTSDDTTTQEGTDDPDR